jgi:hypothetical protein
VAAGVALGSGVADGAGLALASGAASAGTRCFRFRGVAEGNALGVAFPAARGSHQLCFFFDVGVGAGAGVGLTVEDAG